MPAVNLRTNLVVASATRVVCVSFVADNAHVHRMPYAVVHRASLQFEEIEMAVARKLKLGHDEVFPHGAYIVSEVTPVVDYDRSTRETKVQQVDVDTGLPMWSIDVIDADPEAKKKDRTVSVKMLAKVQPVPPASDGTSPFTSVVFENLTATLWVDSSKCRPPEEGRSHRCGAQAAWSMRADGMSAPGKSASSRPTDGHASQAPSSPNKAA